MADEATGVKETAEEAVVETPTTEETPSEMQAQTDAGVTGDIETAEPGEDTTEEQHGAVPYERFREVNERAKAAADLEARVNFFEDVLSDPTVRAAAIQALQAREQGERPSSSAEPVEVRVQQILDAEAPGYTIDDLTVGEQVALRRAARNELAVESRDEAETRRVGQHQAQVYHDHLDRLVAGAGLSLTDKDRAAVDRVATAMAAGYAQMGQPVDPKMVAEMAFNATQADLVKAEQARKSRTAEVTRAKAQITEGRPGGAPTVPGEAPPGGTGREITEQLYDRFYKTS